MVLSSVGIGAVMTLIGRLTDKPVDTSLSREEYVSACSEISPEELYRSSDAYKGKFVKTQLVVTGEVEYYGDGFYYDDGDRYYLCLSDYGGGMAIIVRDCLIEDSIRLVPGDVITVYGQGGGEKTVWNHDDELTSVCLNMAYVEIIEQ